MERGLKLRGIDKQILSYLRARKGQYISHDTIAQSLHYSPYYINQRLTLLENAGLIRRYRTMEVTKDGEKESAQN